MSHKGQLYTSDKGWEAHATRKEIKDLLDQQEDLEKWLADNVGHKDWEKVYRKRHNIVLKITSKEQSIERQEYPDRFKQEDYPYKFTQNIR
jgi:hypothetical protein